ncbi:MAG: TssQ family T6SS-associated lipoprotein [Pseudomonadota bacterium]
MKLLPVLLAGALLATACSTPIVRDAGLDRLAVRKAEKDLSAGIRAYEDGDYPNSARLLQSALSAGLLLNADKVSAYKYLAFMNCAQGRERACREDFRKALAIDPKFELTPAEAGHPMWGPVFKSLK